MESNGVVLSRLVASAGRSLAFYRDGLEIADASMTDGIVALNLPGLTLFLAEMDLYARNTGQDRDALETTALAGSDSITGGHWAEVLSAAIATAAEVDRLVASALAAGGGSMGTRTVEHSSGHRQYIGSITDPDGYLWQLVCNVGRVEE